MNSNELRESFLKFFKEKGHKIEPSSSLVPQGDPTLLLTSAGMVQFKTYFTGELTPPNPRLTTSQKCFRTTDIDEVGDESHLTFFEMLGNFSVGDYFKKESIDWAWEFVTVNLKLSKEKLWITVFLDDDEAENLWLELGVPKDRIVRCDEKDNFWGPAGETGPCGPCSEIHYDFGADTGCGKPDCNPSCECERFLEIWNLVFTELDQDAEGSRTPLKQKNIDTGMGLERTATLMQGKSTLYETDLFVPIMEKITELSGRKYGESDEVTRAMRIVAEHARSVTFLITDGVIPSNDGRGYVLRRILRRAALFGRKLGLNQAFLTEIAVVVIDQMGDVYPELARNREYVLKVISIEEEKFDQTLVTGVQRLEGMIAYRNEIPREWVETVSNQLVQLQSGQALSMEFMKLLEWADKSIAGGTPSHIIESGAVDEWIEAGRILYGVLNEIHNMAQIPQTESSPGKLNTVPDLSTDDIALIKQRNDVMQNMLRQLSGTEVFKLYDTYGFPKEITAEIASENGLTIDIEGFEKEMEAQRERARAAKKFGLADKSAEQFYEGLGLPATEFTGYDGVITHTQILGLIVDGHLTDTAFKGQEVEAVLAQTPFYAEMGGQVGDSGEIAGEQGKIKVNDTRKPTSELVVHCGIVKEGVITVKDMVEARVDEERRLDIARNHTATHLLHKGLRSVLGEQVQQGGSLVAQDYFRFDYTHLVAMSKDELAQVQHFVNSNVRRNLVVSSREMAYQQAIDEGALAFFGDKYGNEVRLVKISDSQTGKSVSAELCGGTHLESTGEIGFFHILSEKSVGSGLRRIEAVTGRGAEALIEERFSKLENIADKLETGVNDVDEKVSIALAELSAERKRSKELEAKSLKGTAEALLAQVRQVNGINVLSAKVDASNMEIMRETGDWLKDKLGSAVIVMGVVLDGNPRFLAMVTSDLIGKGVHAGKIIKEVAQVAGGGGGGKPEMAQAGGKDQSKLEEALELVPGLVEKL